MQTSGAMVSGSFSCRSSSLPSSTRSSAATVEQVRSSSGCTTLAQANKQATLPLPSPPAANCTADEKSISLTSYKRCPSSVFVALTYSASAVTAPCAMPRTCRPCSAVSRPCMICKRLAAGQQRFSAERVSTPCNGSVHTAPRITCRAMLKRCAGEKSFTSADVSRPLSNDPLCSRLHDKRAMLFDRG